MLGAVLIEAPNSNSTLFSAVPGGDSSVLRKPPEGRHRLQQWIVAVFSRIGYHKTLVAIANKHAHIIRALLLKGEAFDVRWMMPAVVAAV